MKTDSPTPASIRIMAMNLLAMREQSAKELEVKLTKKCDQLALIHAALEKLKNDDLQSDKRFAEAYTAMRLRQGKGEQMIRLELKGKGIATELIKTCLLNAVQDTDWNSLALKAYQKKFGEAPIQDLKDKAKRIRFLTARGFSAANIQSVFKLVLLKDE